MNQPWDRRQFLRAAAMLAGAGALSPALRSIAQDSQFSWRNWSAELEAFPALITAPESEQAISQLLQQNAGPVRPIGSGHSWAPLVPTDGTMVTLDGLMGVIEHDASSMQAEVWAGTKLFLLGPMLEQVGQAVLNMSDINYQSLGGALATSTHGTGKELGAMSSFITGIRMLAPNGEALDCSRDQDEELLRAGMNSLGVLGISTRFRLQNQAAHRLKQREWLTTTDEALEKAEQMARDNQQWELFPIPNCDKTIVVVTNPVGPDEADFIEDDPNAVLLLQEAFDGTRWIPESFRDSVFNFVLDLAYGAPKDRIGASYAVLSHVRSVPFMEMEYTVPAERGVECVREVLATIEKNAPHVAFPLEYRYIKADDSLIGMFSERDGCAISVHQFATDPNWQAYLSMVEPIFHRYEGRPHWGKWHSLSNKDFYRLYPNWDQFKRLRAELDPAGKMLNPYLRQLLGVSTSTSVSVAGLPG